MAAVEKHQALAPGFAEERTAAPADLLTVAGMAAVIYCLSTLLHEAGGHGGACLAVGAKPWPGAPSTSIATPAQPGSGGWWRVRGTP